MKQRFEMPTPGRDWSPGWSEVMVATLPMVTDKRLFEVNIWSLSAPYIKSIAQREGIHVYWRHYTQQVEVLPGVKMLFEWIGPVDQPTQELRIKGFLTKDSLKSLMYKLWANKPFQTANELTIVATVEMET